jgi:hypothetical protein
VHEEEGGVLKPLSHSMHLVVRAPAAAVGGSASASRPAPPAAVGSSTGCSQTTEVLFTTAPHASSSAAPAPAAEVSAPDRTHSLDTHWSDRSSAGGSSASGQHADEGGSDGGATGPGFGAQPGLSPMFVFGTHASSSGLLYTGGFQH